MKGKSAELSKEKAARQAVQRLQGSPSERQAKPTVSASSGNSAAEATEETHQQRCQKKDSSGMRGRDRCSGALPVVRFLYQK